MIAKEVSVKEYAMEDLDEFPDYKKKPTKYYENHLQRSNEGYLRYCYFDVKLDGKKIYGQSALILPESMAEDLHFKALEAGVIKPEVWETFAKKVFEFLEKRKVL